MVTVVNTVNKIHLTCVVFEKERAFNWCLAFRNVKEFKFTSSLVPRAFYEEWKLDCILCDKVIQIGLQNELKESYKKYFVDYSYGNFAKACLIKVKMLEMVFLNLKFDAFIAEDIYKRVRTIKAQNYVFTFKNKDIELVLSNCGYFGNDFIFFVDKYGFTLALRTPLWRINLQQCAVLMDIEIILNCGLKMEFSENLITKTLFKTFEAQMKLENVNNPVPSLLNVWNMELEQLKLKVLEPKDSLGDFEALENQNQEIVQAEKVNFVRKCIDYFKHNM